MNPEPNILELGTLVLGLTVVLRPFIPKRFRARATPFLALGLGVGFSLYLNGYSPETIVLGIGLGLSAVGLRRKAEKLDQYQE